MSDPSTAGNTSANNLLEPESPAHGNEHRNELVVARNSIDRRRRSCDGGHHVSLVSAGNPHLPLLLGLDVVRAAIRP